MIPEPELSAHRATTLAFISYNPTVVNLVPRTRVKTGSGTRLVEGPPRGPQTLRIIDQSSPKGPTPGMVIAGDGKQRKVEYQLLGPYNASIGLYDVWEDGNGIRWEIAEILPDNGYERRAQVVRYGES